METCSVEWRFSIWWYDGRVWVWRMQGECYLADCTVQSGGEIMLCGCFFLGLAEGPLVLVMGKLNASVYQDILDNSMLPTWWERFWNVSWHDCAPVHKARSIKAWLDEFVVEELQRSTQILNLNPMEHLWDELKQRWRARPSSPTSV